MNPVIHSIVKETSQQLEHETKENAGAPEHKETPEQEAQRIAQACAYQEIFESGATSGGVAKIPQATPDVLFTTEINQILARFEKGEVNQGEFKNEIAKVLSSQAPMSEKRAELRKKLIQASLSFGNLEMILQIWEMLKNEIVLADVLAHYQKGPDKGKSALWLIACTAGNGKPEAFLAVWEKFKGEIKLADLVAQAQEGANKGMSALWLLAYAASNGNLEAFLAVWEKFKGEIKLADLVAQAQEGANKGMSALWLLAYAANNGKPEVFLAVWEKFKGEIKLADLVAQAQEGPNKGKSVLWLTACAASNGNPEAFLAVWEKFKGEIKLADVVAQAQEGANKGKSVLWLIAGAASNGNPEAFLAVWEKFKGEIKLADLVAQAQEGANKGKSVLWLIACAASNGKPEAFLAVWEKFKGEIKLADVVAQAQEGENKGTSALWLIAGAAGNGKPESFLAVWEKIKGEIKLADLVAQAQEGENKGISALWFIAGAAGNGKPESFLAVWEKIKGEIKLADLVAQAQEGPSRGTSALSMISRMNSPQLLGSILEQAPGVIKDGDLAESMTDNHLLLLIQERNTFFMKFDQMKQQTLSEANLLLLFDEAEKAQKAGYLNAFYDVGCFLGSNQNLDDAYKAYKKVPSTSCHYVQIKAILAEHYFCRAIVPDNSENMKHHHLREALIHALHTDDSERFELIQKIANIYAGCKQVGASNIVPDGLLEAMNSSTSPDWCFDRFEEIKRKIKLETENKELRQKLEVAEKTIAALLARSPEKV